MRAVEPVEIPEAKARQIALSSRGGPKRNVILRHNDKWYDIRHMTNAQVLAFVYGVTEIRSERLN